MGGTTTFWVSRGDAMTSTSLTFDFDGVAIWISTFKQVTPTPVSRGEYGGRVGIVRLLDLLKAKSIPATFFVPAHTASTFPDAVRRMIAEGHEVASHGFLHETPVGLSFAEERELLLRSRDVLTAVSGVTPTGYRSPAWDLSDNTIALLEAEGYIYDSSMMTDDFTPFFPRKGDRVDELALHRGEESRIIEFPVAWELDDYPYFHFAPKPNNQGLRRVADVFDAWSGEFDYCTRNHPSGLFTLTCHPEIVGRGPRIEMLGRLIDHMRERGAAFTTLRAEAKKRLSPAQAGDGTRAGAAI